LAPKATESGKITQNNGRYAVYGELLCSCTLKIFIVDVYTAEIKLVIKFSQYYSQDGATDP